MGLAERLATPPVDTSRQTCTVGFLIKELADNEDVADYRALVDAIGDRRWLATDLARVLGEEQRRVSVPHLRAHRRGEHTEANCAAHEIGVLAEDTP